MTDTPDPPIRRNSLTDPKTLARARELRRTMPVQEVRLWQQLRGKRLCGLRFRRQHPIPPYIVDFYCNEHHLVIEVDGPQHGEAEHIAYDTRRTAYLEAQGLQVLRFTVYEVEEALEGVLRTIAATCGLNMDEET
jgi:very-short-patch-repair endonuclease